MLETQHLSFDHPTQTLSRHIQPLLCDVTWQLPTGSMLHIQGPNGSGKTTLLKLLAGILQPTSGLVMSDGQDIHRNLTLYQQNICYLGHKTGISLGLTVIENCLYDLSTRCFDPSELEDLLRTLSLWHVKELPCYLLSAGQKRRVGLLRLKLSTAKIWLLDEPLVALDSEGIAQLMHLLQTHMTAGGQVVYSSHQSLPWPGATHQVYSL